MHHSVQRLVSVLELHQVATGAQFIMPTTSSTVLNVTFLLPHTVHTVKTGDVSEHNVKMCASKSATIFFFLIFKFVLIWEIITLW